MVGEKSVFPESVDPLMFFQDIDLEHKELMDKFNNLIAAESYDEANTFIAKTDGVHGYFAQTFNALENRIYNTQDYLLTLPPEEVESPFVSTVNADTPPDEYDEDTIWV